MSDRYKGAILSPTAPTVTPQSAGGIYTSSQQLQYQGQGVWPSAFNNPITNSLRFRASASASLSRTPASASNRRTWTFSAWIKRGNVSTSEMTFFSAGADGNNFTAFAWNNNNLFFQNYTSGSQVTATSTAVFRDPSAWYHVVLAIDTTQATAADRAKLYVNGVQQAGFSGASFTQNQQFWINFTYGHRVGSRQLSSADSFTDQYMSEVNFVDGTQLTPSSFGTTDAYGIWQPIPYTGAYGTNGFYLPMNRTVETYDVDFLVVAGGGGGGANGGGAGAGGYRTSYGTSGGGGSAESVIPVAPGFSYTITVGAGGAQGIYGSQVATNGSNSVFSSVTSSGGGYGGGSDRDPDPGSGGNGGSGGGASFSTAAGTGTANQGYAGGVGYGAGLNYGMGGGGGAGAVGAAGASGSGGNGGNGVASTITGSSVTRAGGGGGGIYYSNPAGTGGSGGGGAGGAAGSAGSAGTANTGGGGGGGGSNGSNLPNGGNGGSGVVILRMLTSKYSGVTTGSPTVTTDGSYTVLRYTSSGTYTA